MKKNVICIIAASLFSLCFFRAHGQTSTNSIDSIKSNDYVARKHGVEWLKQQRLEAITNLVSILETNASLEVKESAVIALGNYRASEAVDALAKYVALDGRGKIVVSLVSDEESRPILSAFEKIGNPSIPVIIRLLEQESFSHQFLEKDEYNQMAERNIRNRLLLSLCRIDGNKDIVQLRLEKALKAEKDSQKKAHLQAALKSLAETSSPK